jgi:hypothetical protein
VNPKTTYISYNSSIDNDQISKVLTEMRIADEANSSDNKQIHDVSWNLEADFIQDKNEGSSRITLR